MAVPDTTNFTLENVCDELSLIGLNRNLVQCFESAVSGQFDPAYSGSKNSLLNFRNYGNVVATTEIFLGTSATSLGACSALPQSFYKLASETGGFNTISQLFSDSTGNTNAGANWYSDKTFVRYWNGSSFTIDQFCA